MKIYLVGGSVRDRLLGIIPRDSDFLVINSSEEELKDKGFTKVGQSFPIYLDPVTADEYTLASSLEEDLRRRDLTINAMAIDEEGKIIDLFGGKEDLGNKLLHHVMEENFFTDPLRVMRVARFQAQFPDFTIHPDTRNLMQEVATTSAYKNLLSERIIKELKRVFESPVPSRFFRTLEEVGALNQHFPKGDLELLDRTMKKEDLRFSAFMTICSLEELSRLREKLTIENEWYETARAWILFQPLENRPETLLEYFYAIDAFRKPWILEKMSELGASGMEAFEMIRDIGIRDIDPALSGKDISQAIKEKRLSILKSRS